MSAFKKTFKVVGFGPRKKGFSSRTGEPYDFFEISLGYSRKEWNGLAVTSTRASGGLLDISGFEPGVSVRATCYWDKYELCVLTIDEVLEQYERP